VTTLIITACTKTRLGSHICSCCIYSHASAYQLANPQYPSAAFASRNASTHKNK
jgi:hypothetical protein